MRTPPHPHTPPKKGGVERLESKNLLGDHFVSQNDGFTKGWASDITHGPGKGGIWRPRLRLIQQPSFEENLGKDSDRHGLAEKS